MGVDSNKVYKTDDLVKGDEIVLQQQVYHMENYFKE